VFRFLLNDVDQSASKIIPIDLALANGLKPDVGIAEGQDPVPALDGIKPAEAVLIPTQNNLKFAALGIFTHPEESGPLHSFVTGNPLIDIFPDNLIAVPPGVSLDFGTLSVDALVLFRGRHAIIGNCWYVHGIIPF
jgi:hypothetical protein